MRRHFALVVLVVALLAQYGVRAQRLEPITYNIQIPARETHLIDVTAVVPTSGRDTIELMMPVWSPGYYRVEDYAANVRDLTARTATGDPLPISPIGRNRWRVETRGVSNVRLSYRVFCNQRTVTTNHVDADYAVLNGAPTFITLAERDRRRHDVSITLPPGWTHTMSGLDSPGVAAGALAKAEQFRKTVEGVAGENLMDWFRTNVSSPDELDYRELLEWYGLRFAPSGGKIEGSWKLEARPDQTAARQQNLAAWLAPSKR